jgi:AraC family transcriptional regulator
MQAYAQLHGAEPRIELLPEKKLVGKRLSMTLTNNRTAELWGSFMPRRKEVKNTFSSDLYSMQVYDLSLDFKNFTPDTVFEKWATIEVTEFTDIPEGMESYILKGGLYAVYSRCVSQNLSVYIRLLDSAVRI